MISQKEKNSQQFLTKRLRLNDDVEVVVEVVLNREKVMLSAVDKIGRTFTTFMGKVNGKESITLGTFNTVIENEVYKGRIVWNHWHSYRQFKKNVW